MKNQKNKNQKKEQPPIIDGDSRPDMNVEPDPAIGPVPQRKKKKITAERAADVNRLEDFKDAL